MDKLGHSMKEYESTTTGLRFDRNDVVVARLDGRSFSSFTRDLKKNGTFHEGFAHAMQNLTNYLIETYNPIIGYVQSDEISLIFINNEKSDHPFGGRIFKMQSLMAADASIHFLGLLPRFLPTKIASKPMFDCRVFKVPDRMEAYNCLLWRRKDGYRNAVSAVARDHFSDKMLHGKHRKEQLEMLLNKGVNFHTQYDNMYRFGTFYIRTTETRAFTTSEIKMLPPKHLARSNPNLQVVRHVVREMEFEHVQSHLLS